MNSHFKKISLSRTIWRKSPKNCFLFSLPIFLSLDFQRLGPWLIRCVSCEKNKSSTNEWSENAMAPHSSTLAWKIPWTEERGRLQSMGSWRVSNFTFTFHFHALDKEMATHSSVLAWRIPGTVEPGGLKSMGSHRVGHDWCDLAAAASLYFNDTLLIF